MIHFRIKSQNMIGFVAENASPGQHVTVHTKIPFLTSDDPYFYKLITQISGVFLHKVGFPTSAIFKFLIVLHPDEEADIYINDFSEIHEVKVNRNVEKGERVYDKDISDLKQVKFPDVTIKNDDAIVYCTKIGWKFGFYCDFTREIDLNTLREELGNLLKKMIFEKLVNSADSQLSEISKDIKALIVTEGKTDWKHLKRAGDELNIKLPIKFDEYEDTRGGDDLYKMCEHYSRTPHGKKVIFIFDADDKKIVEKLNKKSTANFQNWGNEVYSFVLRKPLHRPNFNNVEIEFYYTDNEIKTIDLNGRRLFLSSEFSEKTGTHNGLDKVQYGNPKKLKGCVDINNQKIIDDEVYNCSEKNIAMSKSDFAGHVLSGSLPGFKDFNFEEFRIVFDIIEEILKSGT